MKILLVGPQWIGGWVEGVERAIYELGHRFQTFYYDTPVAPNIVRNKITVSSYLPSVFNPLTIPVAESVGSFWEKQMNQKLINRTRTFKPDLILILKGETLQAETLVAIQAPNRKIVSWWLDDPILYFHDYPQVRAQLEHLHTLFVFDRGRFKELNGFGARQVAYLPCAFDPTIYHPKQVSIEEMNRYQCDVGLVASYYPKRGELVKHMQGLDVAIWGVGWKDKPEIKAFPQGVLRGKSLEGPDIATAYNVMRISPNLHHSQTILGGLNMRAFEIPAAGGFQLMDEVPGAEELFEPGSELVMYHSTAHFRELVDYYLSHPSERDAIARRGYERAIRQHTYKHRLQVMLETVENSQ